MIDSIFILHLAPVVSLLSAFQLFAMLFCCILYHRITYGTINIIQASFTINHSPHVRASLPLSSYLLYAFKIVVLPTTVRSLDCVLGLGPHQYMTSPP